MKTLLVGINAKYIHPNLAIRLLQANTKFDCDIVEFNIKDSIEDIYNYVNKYDIIGFSCYIWNIELIKQIIKIISKDKIIILGGPEVSYNAEYYLNNNLCSYVIKNEGEESFNKLLDYIINDNGHINDIPNLYYSGGYTFDKYVDIKKSNMAYNKLNDVKNQIVYIETSRGCPYHCGYCMASLDNKVRFFDIEKIKSEILTLINKDAKVFKFLDRTFNANKQNFLSLIDFIIQNHKKNNSFQFEITGDLLDEDVIEYINTKAPKNLFRFEIGIQSTNIKSNRAVGRIQNNEKLFKNIRLIQDKGVIDLHLDLIAGLPYEDYNSFINTFNEVLSLRPKELQLGFLKLLHGTSLYKEKDKYNYKYSLCAPYEIIENDYMSPKDILNIHITEEAFEKYYNSIYYKNSINNVLDKIPNAYSFFYDLGLTIKDKKPRKLEDSFRVLDDYIKTIFDNTLYNNFHEDLIMDYLNYYNIKPKAWWKEKFGPKEKNSLLRQIKTLYSIDYSIDELYKYSMIIKLENSFILAVYKQDSKFIKKFQKI